MKLEPAIFHKEELVKEYAKFIISDHAINYSGYYQKYEIKIEDSNWDNSQWVLVKDDKVLGYLSFAIDGVVKIVANISTINFSSDVDISICLFENLERKIKEYFEKDFYKIEFSTHVGSPVEKLNDMLIKRHRGGRIVGVFIGNKLDMNYKRISTKWYEIINPKFLEQ